MKAKIHVTLKNGVLDPQGKAIANTLHALGFDAVEDVRQGKYIELDLKHSSAEDAKAAVEAMCSKLLANTVIENYRYELAD
jgi:phosphoribosylformylglycinamidine synthase